VEGLRGLSELPLPALILLDLRLPVMSGVEFLALQRSYYRWATIPVVVITAEHGELGALQARAVLYKPVDWEAVFDTIQAYCPIVGRGGDGGPPDEDTSSGA
jgi:CheY-like chemotaxis protein